MKENLLKLKQICFEIDSNIILKDINLEIDEGNFVSIIGKSGSGKTSLLKIISGLKKQTKGTIILNNTILSDDDTFVEPESRNLGLVVQEKVLFPHLNTRKNIEFGISSKTDKQNRSNEIMEKLNIQQLADKYPHELSGGESQRVALARSIVMKPKLLMLDEPFTGLDKELKIKIYPEIKSILQESKITCLMVTHNLNEVKALADQCFNLESGKLIEI